MVEDYLWYLTMEIPEPLPGTKVSFESPDKSKNDFVISIPNTN